MAADIQVQGADAMQDSLHKAAQRVQDMTAPNLEVARLAASGAQPPRRTGRLAGSIRPSATATEAIVSVAQPYAGVIENGWAGHNIAPTRFLRSAFADVQSAADRVYAKAGQDLLSDVKGA